VTCETPLFQQGKARAEQKRNNNKEKKKAFKLIFIKTFKSITKEAAEAELHKEK